MGDQTGLLSEKYDQSIEGVCSGFFPRESEEFENLMVVLLSLIDSIIRDDRGLPRVELKTGKTLLESTSPEELNRITGIDPLPTDS